MRTPAGTEQGLEQPTHSVTVDQGDDERVARPAASSLAWTCASIALGLVVASVALALSAQAGFGLREGLSLAYVLTAGATGGLVASRHPRNAIGWIGLFDIDVVISRTLVYVPLIAIIGGVSTASHPALAASVRAHHRQRLGCRDRPHGTPRRRARHAAAQALGGRGRGAVQVLDSAPK
jgi:hypothetical protein